MEKIYRVQMNMHGAPDFSTAEEVDTTSEWIPVSERLPEKYTKVLVTNCAMVTIGWRDDYNWRIIEQTTPSVIAWMPLPKRYRLSNEA